MVDRCLIGSFNMWAWLTALIKGILQAVLPFLWNKAEQPNTIKDEKVPEKFKDALDADLADKLRSEQSSNPADWSS